MGTAAIVGGSPETGMPAVVALVLPSPVCGEGAGSPMTSCSGALIGPRHVLTAAHCVNGEEASPLQVVLAPVVGDAAPEDLRRVVEVRVHPDADGREHDLAILILDADADVAALPWLDAGFESTPTSAALVVAGYGVDEDGSTGVARSGSAALDATTTFDFTLVADPAMTCDGDSGGPVLLDGAIAGVTSFGDADCTVGTAIRVDAHAAFIRGVLDENPAPRPAFDPAADYCAASCVSDADCPAGMTCTGDRCALIGFEPGAVGAACDDTCGEAPCAVTPEGCRCYPTCDPPDGGCCHAGDPAATSTLLLVLVCSLAMRRRANDRLQ